MHSIGVARPGAEVLPDGQTDRVPNWQKIAIDRWVVEGSGGAGAVGETTQQIGSLDPQTKLQSRNCSSSGRGKENKTKLEYANCL